jgi:hypothetical protein
MDGGLGFDSGAEKVRFAHRRDLGAEGLAIGGSYPVNAGRRQI